ncbi:hypothetical protein NW766_007200 [Fusarium irregulare]|uniref:Uncharacterized protein n=1 Tax=Fusarium irregulare TaxID=2494466 RepID=A0A9W8U7U7_9HYPO|nr:hypothetical protein NW766_007200 [Fusarium irregulare]
MLKDPDLIRTNSEMEREKEKQAKSSPPVVGVQKVYDLVHNDPHGGLSYFYYTASDDPSTRTPRDRAAYLHWMSYKSPVMHDLSAPELLIQRTHGLRYRYRRPDHDANEKSKVIATWNDPKSGNEVFIANANAMGTGVNMHGGCSKGMFLNWLMNAKSMLQIIGRLIRINQEDPVTFHLLKTKNCYYDNIEEVLVESIRDEII